MAEKEKEKSELMSDIMKGAQEGAVDAAILSATGPISEALSASLVEKLGSENPLLASLAESGANFLVLLAFAEGLAIVGSQLDGVIEDADEKSVLLARYLRKLAGKQLGEKGVELLIQNLAGISQIYDSVKTEDLKRALGEESTVKTEPVPEDLAEPEQEELVEEQVEEEFVLAR